MGLAPVGMVGRARRPRPWRYQPIVDLETEDLTGVEALLRWRHPARGVIEPDAILPVAGDSGLIVPIGHWVIEHSCEQAAVWRAGEARGRTFSLSVNVSLRQLEDPDLVTTVRQALRKSELPPESLILEIPEAALLQSSDVIWRLRQLRAIGVRLAVDDVGADYASLGGLDRQPVDMLKIDRAFMHGFPGERESSLARGIVELARSMDVPTVAEGIEEPGQLTGMQALGCQYGQGFLFAHPLSPEQIGMLFRADPAPSRPLADSATEAAAGM